MAYKEEREERKEEKHESREQMPHAKDKMAEICRDGKQGEHLHFRGNIKVAVEHIEKQPK